MKILEQDFIPLLFGNDINSYSMARAFHEACGVRSTVVGKYISGPNVNSAIVDFRAIETIDEDAVFLSMVNSFAEEKKGKKVLVIGCGDNYISLISKNKPNFAPNVVAPYIVLPLLTTLIQKEQFYKICQQYSIPYPKTYIYRRGVGTVFDFGFSFPVIAKPSNSVEYWNCPFATQKKVYKADTRDELVKILDDIYGAGYKDAMVIQDFIPGDDTYMRVLTCYSDMQGKVQRMALGHVLLEEHTPHGLGNHAVIINDYDEPLMSVVKNFLEKIQFKGFSNFDIKYDTRDGVYKIFEINVRQGRSNFYVTGAGDNLAQVVVEDAVYGRPLTFKNTTEKHLWLVVPFLVALIYVRSKKLRLEMLGLALKGKLVNPLWYTGDYSWKRSTYLWKSHFSHFFKYFKYYR